MHFKKGNAVVTQSWLRLTVVSTLLIGCATTLTSERAEAAAPADSQESVGSRYVRAELYFVPWWVLTRAALSSAQVREHPYVSIRVENEQYVFRLVTWLNLDGLVPAPTGVNRGDARLVIDLFDSTGARTTFYADQFNLMSEDASKRRHIDKEFRNAVCLGAMSTMVEPDTCQEE